ncbi:hypothetical protein [Candidatus Contendibacter odensensis]|uniref:Uncharacterized protein n=1 Tax=Candidatus Contendobacter odensis Run_B_J11 TaxID=1400861 RepID=A0A7U7J541_9GAMM|nr:hypothetical protein [Candidatus Contendobacter odensis]CDH46312.1 conserved hypothetical protein [Candidatus Contendobacter odensis Run_B_J11]
MPRTARNIVEESLTKQRADALWTANYLPALPMTPQNFDVGALLPAMLYLARWGHRRGVGRFAATFGQQEGKIQKPPTIADVARRLVQPESTLGSFNDAIGQYLLGDLLLAYCLENKGRALGHNEQVQRIFPAHYLSSWVDLPKEANHLRGVPELLTVLLNQQKTGQYLESGNQNRKEKFAIGAGFSDNALLTLFGQQMLIQGQNASNLTSDFFVEENATNIGIDELLAVRTAQACGSAPLKAKGIDVERIFNRHPLAHRAAEALREDLSIFIMAYGDVVPRQAFLQMLEAGISVGMTNLLLSTTSLLTVWEVTGQVPEATQQISLPLFVDCSQGQDKILRDLSEGSTSEGIRRFERLPLLMMLLRVLDDRVRIDRKLRDSLPANIPDATDWINLLGEIYQERHPRSDAITNALDEDCQRLAEPLENDPDIAEPEIAHHLRHSRGNPALRLAETLCELMGDKLQRTHYVKCLENALMTDQPNGFAIKRRVQRSQSGSNRRMDLRSIVLTTPLLEFLVHRHLRRTATDPVSLSLQGFIKLLRDRYGLYIAQEPPGQPIPQEMLLRNKAYLERRLRDLGLLIGVNDAESMKQLKSHYRVETCNVA